MRFFFAQIQEKKINTYIDLKVNDFAHLFYMRVIILVILEKHHHLVYVLYSEFIEL